MKRLSVDVGLDEIQKDLFRIAIMDEKGYTIGHIFGKTAEDATLRARAIVDAFNDAAGQASPAMPEELKTIPQVYYRIMAFGPDNHLELFNTAEFGEPNNWFEDMEEAENFIEEHFVDHHVTPEDPAHCVLTILPVWTVKTKGLRPKIVGPGYNG
jgi:hypothetical protein